MGIRQKKPSLLSLLLAKLRADPEGFRAYFPEVARELEAHIPPVAQPRSPFGLTEREQRHRAQALSEVLRNLEMRECSSDEAVKGLEHAAVLILDDSLPDVVDHELLVKLVQKATGKSARSVRSNTTLRLPSREGEKAVTKASLVRGVTLNLTRDLRLVSITVIPRKLRERRKALLFVGVAQDVATDVAREHDRYLTEGNPHAAP